MYTEATFDAFITDTDHPFSGWDFSFVSETGRMQSGLLPWSYGSLVLPYVRESQAMLDMGTGGGEFLVKLQPFPQMVCATEGYAPNVPVARTRLEPLGVQVEEVAEDDSLSFADGQFDLVLNRHESYDPAEVRRVLKPGGTFITQQVGGLDCAEINEVLGVPLNPEFLDWNLPAARQALEAEGFRIVRSEEAAPPQRFYDIGALVYYLKAIPWQVPDFEVETYREKLLALHELIQRDGYFEVRQRRFLVVAER